MKDNKYYFEYLLEQIKHGKYRKVSPLKNGKGYQVKFGRGVLLNVDINEGRAIILTCDNGEQDVIPIVEAINQAQAHKVTTRLTQAQDAYNKAVNNAIIPHKRKSFLQRLFRL